MVTVSGVEIGRYLGGCGLDATVEGEFSTAIGECEEGL